MQNKSKYSKHSVQKNKSPSWFETITDVFIVEEKRLSYFCMTICRQIWHVFVALCLQYVFKWRGYGKWVSDYNISWQCHDFLKIWDRQFYWLISSRLPIRLQSIKIFQQFRYHFSPNHLILHTKEMIVSKKTPHSALTHWASVPLRWNTSKIPVIMDLFHKQILANPVSALEHRLVITSKLNTGM